MRSPFYFLKFVALVLFVIFLSFVEIPKGSAQDDGPSVQSPESFGYFRTETCAELPPRCSSSLCGLDCFSCEQIEGMAQQCARGMGATPTPTEVPSFTATTAATVSPTPTANPASSHTATPAATASPVGTSTPTAQPTQSATASPTAEATLTAKATQTTSPTPTTQATETVTATPTWTATPDTETPEVAGYYTCGTWGGCDCATGRQTRKVTLYTTSDTGKVTTKSYKQTRACGLKYEKRYIEVTVEHWRSSDRNECKRFDVCNNLDADVEKGYLKIEQNSYVSFEVCYNDKAPRSQCPADCDGKCRCEDVSGAVSFTKRILSPNPYAPTSPQSLQGIVCATPTPKVAR